MSESCVFCAISERSAEAHVVSETNETIAFLDRSPLFKGHVLVVPKQHVVTLMGSDSAVTARLFEEVRRVSIAVQNAMGCTGIFVAVNNGVSQSVAHLHVHVVPRNKKDGLRGFMWPRTRYESPGEAGAVASSIGRHL